MYGQFKYEYNYFIVGISHCNKPKNERFRKSLFKINVNMLCESSRPHPCVRLIPPPNIFKPATRQHSTVGRTGSPLPPPATQAEWRAGSRDTGRDSETTCGAYKCQRRCTRDFILQRYMIKQVGVVLQGPKSKTLVLIGFMIVEGFNISFAYINAMKHLKKNCKRESTNYYINNGIKN